MLQFAVMASALSTYRVYRTQSAGPEHLVDIGEQDLVADGDGAVTFDISLEREFQTIMGFGSALTEASAFCWAKLNNANKEAVIDLLYGKNGLDYQIGRCHIGSADFSISEYGYIEDGDKTLATWSFDREREYVVPFVKAAVKANPDLWLFGSPWSPPAHFKDNKKLIGGGKLLSDYREVYAQYFVKYLQSYKDEGVDFSGLTVQNEPLASQSWESCIWSGQEEAQFAVQHLRPALDAAGFGDIKIQVWDHNRDVTESRASDSYGVSGATDAIWGVANHWYGGDHWDALDVVHEKWPTHHLTVSELCRGDWGGSSSLEGRPYANWEDAAAYAHEYIGDLQHWVEFVCDWNAILDQDCGPYHNRDGGVKAPIIVDTAAGTFSTGFIYDAVGHFSKFIKKGAVRIGLDVTGSGLEGTAAKNIDGTVAVVILNRESKETTLKLKIDGKVAVVDVPAKSLHTVIVG